MGRQQYQSINFPGAVGTNAVAQTIPEISVLGPTNLPQNVQDVGIDNNANDIIIQLPEGALSLRTVLWCQGVGNDVILRPLPTEGIGTVGIGVDLTVMNMIGTILLQGVAGGWQVITMNSASVSLVL